MLYELLTLTNIIWVLFFLTCLIFLIQNTQRPTGIPPGPRRWIPLIGNLLELGNPDPRIPFRNLRKIYGDIYSLYLGNKLMIVINGYENIKDAFVKNGDVFSDRPDLYLFTGISKGQGIVCSSGNVWKEQRTFAVATLREFGFGKTSLECKIEEEITPFLHTVEESNGQTIDIRPILQISISNIICNLAFGHRFEYDNKEFLHFMKLLDDNMKVLGSTSIVNIYPILRYIPFDPFKIQMVTRNAACIDKYFEKIVEEHKRSFDKNNVADFTDAYIKEMKKCKETDPDTSFTDSQLIKVIGDFLAAGTETTATTLLWAFLYLMKFPEVQDRMRKEIDDNIGRNRPPSLRDRTSLVYSEAVILETLRFANVVPDGIPHGVSHATDFHGYNIPKEAVVVCNIDSVLNDPHIWEYPEKFEPTRFIDDKGLLMKPDGFFPFSIGRRACLGESLARMELFLFLTAILQRFVITPPEAGTLPTLDGIFGIVHQPEQYELRLISRDD